MRPILHIITGPTAVGKTDFALSYAEMHNAEIVSCDALLVYQGMDIGTAKPSLQERKHVPHHMIDVHPVDRPYDIVAYVSAAEKVVAEITARGRSVVIVGGSGFYLKSFFAPVVDDIVVSDTIRQQVAEIYATLGLRGLLNELNRLNPLGLGKLDTLNPRRVQRALERCIASGRALVDLQAEFVARPEPYANYTKKYILLEREPEELRERIVQRVNKMLEDGLVDEVCRLRKLGIEQNACAASAIGYRETLSYLKEAFDHETLQQKIIQNTYHLVKKQRTWFRTQIRKPDEYKFMNEKY